MARQPILTPSTDGTDHVNIYSRARTPEGRLLSNFAETPFTLHGTLFASAEGFYQSMLFDEDAKRREVAATSGSKAKAYQKQAGKKPGDPVRLWDGRVVPYHGEEFHAEFARGIEARVRQHPSVLEALLGTENLPLDHYYTGRFGPVRPAGDRGWLQGLFTAMRQSFPDQRRETDPLADVLAALRNPDEGVRLRAARVLVGKTGPMVWAALADALEDASQDVRHRAMRTLVQLDLPVEEAEAIFTRAAANESAVVRTVAIKRVGRLAEPGEGARRALQKALTDEEKIVRRLAGEALARLGALQGV
jgi:predicted NAD-dependent protein-ADP-ribosyltransferase YbiA (DUF1768 family)